MTPFFILATPRSGTAWLANFLHHGEIYCRHEWLSEHASLADFRKALTHAKAKGQRAIGTVDTLAPLIVERLKRTFPAARWVILERDWAEIERSIHRLGYDAATTVERGGQYISEARLALPGAFWLAYPDLHREKPMRALWQHLGATEPFPRERWDQLREQKVELLHFGTWLEARRPNIEALLTECLPPALSRSLTPA